ncbi:hypothetical protein CARUB_v10002540mg [Capsella rubella]|uniref:Uncharacterized protein n=1 Tax=Capsella rubella TaxID=81985 RepID=R0FI41_9BRAS|nr:hypothetical protein CARUB_v10002540mg [Capsella rubella]
MKTNVLFLTLLICISSCTSIFMKTSNSKAIKSAATPPISFELGEDIHIKPSLIFGERAFCYDCGKACHRRNRLLVSVDTRIPLTPEHL